MGFAEEVADAIRQGEAELAGESARAYGEVLTELVAGLNITGIGARAQKLAGLGQVVLAVYPRFQPSRVSYIQRYTFEADQVRVSGEPPLLYSAPEEFKDYLLAYVKTAAFLEGSVPSSVEI